MAGGSCSQKPPFLIQRQNLSFSLNKMGGGKDSSKMHTDGQTVCILLESLPPPMNEKAQVTPVSTPEGLF